MSVIDKLVLGHGLTEELAREVERWEERLRARTVEAGIEFAASLDAETYTLVGPPLGGTAVEVDIDDHVRLMQGGRRYVTLHTHPASSAFSDLDVSTFIGVAMLMVMVVAGADGSWYVLSKPKDAHLPAPVEAAQRLRAEVIRGAGFAARTAGRLARTLARGMVELGLLQSGRAERGRIMTRERGWPSLDEVQDKAKKHVLDDRMAAVPPYDLEDWEILGNPAPAENATADERRAAPKRSRRPRGRR